MPEDRALTDSPTRSSKVSRAVSFRNAYRTIRLVAVGTGQAARRLWFQSDCDGWTPRLFEWYFTRTKGGKDVRRAEEAGVLAVLDPFLDPAHHAADVGAGPGHYTLLLARRCASVVAVDANPSMRAYLRDRLDGDGLTNVQVMCGRLPEQPALDTQVDVVVCIGVLQYVEDLHAAVASLAGIVRPGGRVIFSVTPATRSARGYARQELLLGRRRVWLRTDSEVRAATDRAGLKLVDPMQTHAGVTRVVSTERAG